jgi:hypothetical protein
LVLALACTPLGAVLGHIALRQIRERGEHGRGLAMAGVIIGWIGIAVVVLILALAAFGPVNRGNY